MISDLDIYSEFESSIRGGYVNAIKNYIELNNKNLDNFDPSKPISSAAILDVNSLYPTTMVNKLPYGELEELTESEIDGFDIMSIEADGDYAYALLVDYSIPDATKLETDELPLSIHKMTVTEDDISSWSKKQMEYSQYKMSKSDSLIADHTDQSSYLISIDRLQILMGLGVKVTKIHRIFRFKQDNFLEDFIRKNIHLRSTSNCEFTKTLYKLINNSLFGKFLFNSRKNAEQTKIVLNKKHFDRVASSPLLKECTIIGENKVIARSQANSIRFDSPLHLGWFILERSKTFMYDLFYNKIKKWYPDGKVSLAYTDTDSLLLVFHGIDFMHEAKYGKISTILDRSNFGQDHPLYDDSNKGKLGFLKSETGPIAIKEVIALQAKCYSILLNDDSTKKALKGIPVHIQKNKIMHETYRKVYDRVQKSVFVKVTQIRSKNCELFTTRTEKCAIRWFDNKRWYDGPNKSVAYGHPSIVRNPKQIISNDDKVEKTVKFSFKPVKRSNPTEPWENMTHNVTKKAKLAFT